MHSLVIHGKVGNGDEILVSAVRVHVQCSCKPQVLLPVRGLRRGVDAVPSQEMVETGGRLEVIRWHSRLRRSDVGETDLEDLSLEGTLIRGHFGKSHWYLFFKRAVCFG